MGDEEAGQVLEKTTPAPSAGPLVFISHDSRDALLAEAFSKLLKSVSAGMIKTFYSSDKSPGGGIEYGDEWYKRLMERLAVTTDVVCLFTKTSLDRPWILFEAGVAKGKLDTPVMGLAIGVPLDDVSSGPFYQFQNMEAGEAELTKLLTQLAQRVDGLLLDPDVVRDQIQVYKAAEATFGAATGGDPPEEEPDRGVAAVAKLAEEMKALPARVAERVAESTDPRRRPRRFRLHPRMFDELLDIANASEGDPGVLLMAADLVREDLPWLYEAAVDVYRAAKVGDRPLVDAELGRLRSLSEMGFRTSFLMKMGGARDSEAEAMAYEWPQFFHHLVNVITDIGAASGNLSSLGPGNRRSPRQGGPN